MKYSLEKIRKRLWAKIVFHLRNTFYYPFLYKSYIHSLLVNNKNNDCENNKQYLAAIPNPGAGIGHQLANWIAGYWWSKQLNLYFAHSPFPSMAWEHFLGLGENEISVRELINDGYKQVLIPLFDEFKVFEVERVKQIINSYKGQKVVFVCERDQYYKAQFEVIEDLQSRFYSANARKSDTLIYDRNCFNVAIHVRRGDIVKGQMTMNPNLLMRWQDDNYFSNVLENTLKFIKTKKPVKIYLFSQGKESDFTEFLKKDNLFLCLDMGTIDSFLHMVFADVLITSKSSFSYKPALLSKGIKVCPNNFWHDYPVRKDWVLADENGAFVF